MAVSGNLMARMLNFSAFAAQEPNVHRYASLDLLLYRVTRTDETLRCQSRVDHMTVRCWRGECGPKWPRLDLSGCRLLVVTLQTPCSLDYKCQYHAAKRQARVSIPVV